MSNNMQPDNEGNLLEIIDLAHTLRQEQLFIRHEQDSFIDLRKSFGGNSAKVAQLAWICAQHKQNLYTLIVTRKDFDPSVCCRRANCLEHTKFVEAHKAPALRYEHVLSYGKLFDYLYKSPYILAQGLAAGDRIATISNKKINSIVHTIATGLYGNIIHSKDIEMTLKLLRELIEIQIINSENPRRMLRTGSSAFAMLYNRLLESLFSAKIFLTAALYEPIMKVLIESETALDIDPLKALMNFSSKERIKRFGQESDANYNANVEKYRNETVQNLYLLAKFFLNSLIHNWSLFPSTLRWLIQTMCHQLKQAKMNDKTINEILTDMVFTHFICPVIVSPDIYGISDAPISEQARFNLIQIGQIIQMLALMKYEDVDPKLSDVYQKFDANIVSSLLDQLLVSDNGEMNSVVAIRSQQSDFERANVLITQKEVIYLVDFLRSVLNSDEINISAEDSKKLLKILDELPEKLETTLNGNGNVNYQSVSPQHETANRAKQSLINLGKNTKNKIAKTISMNINGNSQNPEADTDSLPSNGNGCVNGNVNLMVNGCGASAGFNDEENEFVLIFDISISDENKFQLLTEDDFLKMNSIGQEIEDPGLIEENIEKLDKIDGFNGLVSSGIRPSQSKTTRFSMSQDDASIGNSDNLEAVSEAPSNHSVTSSLELEENDQNDNLSDMVSANVSGRGSPNISGRDTPSSQVTDGDNTAQIPTPQMAKIINKARSEIEDKFCKFEIKKLIEGDETVSIISDTWSTDVLASDSETLDANERDRNFSTPLIPSNVVLPGDNNFDVLGNSRPRGGSGAYLDVSETRSESAWSTDVLISDSEKLNEVDTDDNLSITAKSDITDAGGRSEGEPSRSDLENLVNTVNNNANENDREREINPNANRTPDSPFFAPRTGSNFHHTPDSPVYVVRGNVEPPFFPLTNSYEDPNRETSRFASPISSLARSSVRTSSNYSSENNFQQNYKSPGIDKQNFLPVTSNVNKMRRQNSAESSISNQSSNLDENFEKPSSADAKLCNRNESKEKARNSAKDLIDFSDFAEEEGASGVTVDCDSNGNPNGKMNDEEEFKFYDKFSEEHVIHRRTSSENRNASFDGRRNGMMEYKAGDSSSKTKSRRHQSLNYENHSIIINKTTTPQRVIDLPEQLNGEINISLTDNIKTETSVVDEMLIIQKTENLHLNTDSNDGSSTPRNEVSIDIIEPTEMGEIIQVNGGPSNGGLKPSKSTGAIPKSISFDSTADKSSRCSNGRRVNDPLRTSFFTKIKQGFKNRRQHKSRNIDELMSNPRIVTFVGDGNDEDIKMRNGIDGTFPMGNGEIAEDILAKYRRKVSTSSETTNSDSTGNSCSVNRKNSDIEARSPSGILNDKTLAFIHAKKKIRLVLSKADLHTGDFRHTTHPDSSPLLIYLQIQLAQALNLQDFSQISYVSEAIRTLNSLDMSQHLKLIEELQGDILKRQSYLQYLMRYRQNFLSTIENLNQFKKRLKNDQQTCNRHLISVCVRMFLEKRELLIETFQTEFCQLTVVDEKIYLLQEFIDDLIKELKSDGILFNMVEWQLDEAKISIERVLLQRLYKHVMFPNEDMDMSRDKVFQDHIRKIQKIITPHHKALRISQEYLSEAPWPFAQKQISYISAYKTPTEKFECIKRCILSIINLLSIACDRIPAADDIVPVLIYVIIMANPPYLLSTIQYVDCFIRSKLEGEDEYQWTQFCSAVELIKTITYSD